MKANIDLHIDKLVLEGISADQYGVAEAVQSELTKLLTQGDLSVAENINLLRLNGQAFALQSNSTEGIGNQVAQSVYKSLGGISESRGGGGDYPFKTTTNK